MTAQLSDKVYSGVMRNLKKLKEEIKEGVVSEVLSSSREEIVKEYLPKLSESVADNLMTFLSKTDKVSNVSIDERYYHLVENMKTLMLPFLDKDKVAIMEEQQNQFGGQIMKLTEDLNTVSSALTEAIQEVKLAYKKLNMTTQAYESALATVEAYKLLENQPRRNDIKEALFNCSSVDEVRTTFNRLMTKEKINTKLDEMNGLKDFDKVIKESNSGGRGFVGAPVAVDKEKFEQQRLAGVIK